MMRVGMRARMRQNLRTCGASARMRRSACGILAYTKAVRQADEMTNEYRSLKDHVYNHIVDLIDGGTLADDHKISEQQICDALGVSRTPVREALIQLAADGYLENVPRKLLRQARDGGQRPRNRGDHRPAGRPRRAVGRGRHDRRRHRAAAVLARFHAAGHREGPLQEIRRPAARLPRLLCAQVRQHPSDS